MAHQCHLYTIGEEFPEIKYNSFLEWFVQLSDLETHWKHQPTYILSQFAFCLGGLATLIHAITRGGRLPYLWLGIFLHGLVIECMCFASPHIDNYWHSQTTLMFLGNRLPLHITLLYPCFLYNASIAVAKLKLPIWSEPFAAGLLEVLVNLPYDIVSVNYLHWTWHDTDPNIADRTYWVPWNSYYFHTCFGASFTFWFHFLRRKICSTEKWEADTFWKEMLCTILAAFLGTPGGILLFLPVYHPLHEIYKVHSEVTYFIIVAILLLIIWSGDRASSRNYKNSVKYIVKPSGWILFLHLIVHYATFLIIPIFFNSEDEIAIGLKERIGPCNETVTIKTAFGMDLERRKYLCPTDYNEDYFDWSCLPNGKPPSDGSYWYTACGVALPNRAEIITIVGLICIVASTVFTTLHYKAFGDEVFNKKIAMEQRKKNK